MKNNNRTKKYVSHEHRPCIEFIIYLSFRKRTKKHFSAWRLWKQNSEALIWDEKGTNLIKINNI